MIDSFEYDDSFKMDPLDASLRESEKLIDK